jgi:uncharacterized protein YtpQ (UPF0354 family)
MRLLAIAALLAAACGKAGSPAAKSPQALLRDDVQRRVAAALPGATLVPKDDLTITLKRADGTEQEMRLDNLWHDIDGAAPAERESMIARYVKFAVATTPAIMDADLETKLKAIVPLVRDEGYLEEMRKLDRLATRPLAADMHIVYAYDQEESLTMIPLAEAESLKIDAEELHRRAVENLNALIGAQVELHAAGPMFMLTCGGVYESSLLATDKLWTKLAEQVKGDIVAACPARDLLLFADASNPEGIAALKKAVEDAYAEGGRTISRKLLRRTPDGWKPFENYR